MQTFHSQATVGSTTFYRFDNGAGMTQPTAKAHCLTEGLVLCKVSSQEEQDAIWGLSRGAPNTASLWIGLQKANSGSPWLWQDNSSPSYLGWVGKEPSSPNSDFCSHIWDGTAPAGWNDIHCTLNTHPNGFICSGPATSSSLSSMVFEVRQCEAHVVMCWSVTCFAHNLVRASSFCL